MWTVGVRPILLLFRAAGQTKRAATPLDSWGPSHRMAGGARVGTESALMQGRRRSLSMRVAVLSALAATASCYQLAAAPPRRGFRTTTPTASEESLLSLLSASGSEARAARA